MNLGKSLSFLFVLLLLTVGMSSCNFLKHEKQEKPIARAWESFLYPADIKTLVPKGTSAEDSVELVRKFIDNWIQQTLLLHKADLNLTEEKKNVTQMLNNYRNSLIIYAYEKELIKQKLDTVVKDDEVATYYEQHQNDFLLKDYIVRVKFAKLDKKTPNYTKLKRWFYSEEKKDRIELERYCYQFAQKYSLNDETWIFLEEVLKEVPIKVYNEEQFLANNKRIEFEADNSIYLLHIKEFRLKDNISPLEFEHERIANIIINKRKLQLVNTMKTDIYEEALIKGYFEMY